MTEILRTPRSPWRYVDWLGGQEEFDEMFSKYPEEKSEFERSIMCAGIIDRVMVCFWGPPELFPAWVKKHYPHLDSDWVDTHYPHLDLA